MESHVRDMLRDGKLIFASYYSAERVLFHSSDGDIIVKPLVYCKDVIGLITLLAFLRDMEVGDMLQKVGIDNGKGHLQMILTLYTPDELYRYSFVHNCGVNSITPYWEPCSEFWSH